MAEIENRPYVKELSITTDHTAREFEVQVVYRVPHSLVRRGTDLMIDVLSETVAQQVREAVWKMKREEF